MSSRKLTSFTVRQRKSRTVRLSAYKYCRYCQFVSTFADGPYSRTHLRSTPLRNAHTGPQSTESGSLLRRGRSGGGSGSGKVCRELGVNKLLDTNDLVTLRAEREDVYGFAVELMPSREFAIEPRLQTRGGGAIKSVG